MTQQVINRGSAPNDGTGEGGYTAWGKTNANFTELYAANPLTVPTGTILGNNSGSTAAPTGITGMSVDTAGNLTGKKAIFQGNMAITTAVTPNIQSAISVSGTTTSAGIAAYNTFNVNSDSLDTTTSGQGGSYNIYAGHTISNASMTGNRTCVDGLVFLTAPSGNVNPNYFYVGTAGQFNASANDNGVAGLGNQRGNGFGMFASTRLQSGATFWNAITGMEIDIGVNSGADVNYETGLQIVHWSTSVNRGSIESTALSFNDQVGSTTAWDRLIGIGSTHGIFPVNGGTIMGAVPTALGGSAYSVAHGIDLSGLTCTVDAFKSSGFSVDGAGITVTKTVKTTPLTVATLPAAATAGAGTRAFVTDANATTFASVVAGGGANGVPVYSDGTNWRIG